jgi:hypothetical protein
MDLTTTLDPVDLRPMWAQTDVPPPALKAGPVAAAVEALRRRTPKGA